MLCPELGVTHYSTGAQLARNGKHTHGTPQGPARIPASTSLPASHDLRPTPHLSDAVRSVHALVVCGWVPGGVNNDHAVCSSQGQAEATHLHTQTGSQQDSSRQTASLVLGTAQSC
jgi:hypothetical protein